MNRGAAVRRVMVAFLLYFTIDTVSDLFYLQLFGEKTGALFCLMLAALTTIPFAVFLYRKSLARFPFSLPHGKEIGMDFLMIGAILAAALLLNVLFAHLPAQFSTAGFESAQTTLSDGGLFLKILAEALIIPALEELVFRGLICGELASCMPTAAACILSALIFGILHFNVIQFLYSFTVGLLLGFFYLKSKRLLVPYLGHALSNLIVVLIFAS